MEFSILSQFGTFLLSFFLFSSFWLTLTKQTNTQKFFSTARQARLGTASMVAQRDAVGGGQFLNLARLNVEKYARDPAVNRHLFDYVFYHEADMKTAHQVHIFCPISIFFFKCSYFLSNFNIFH
jgi:hypothetical protein